MKDKIILITGANRGIGHNILKKISTCGFTVIGTSRSKDGADMITETLKNSKGKGIVMDVTNQESIDTSVSQIKGDENGVNALELLSTNSNEKKMIKLDGVFIAIGHVPSTEPFKNSIDMYNEGYIISKKPGTSFTNVDGVFAAGDCVDKIYRQAVTAAGMGCMAALDAEKWLQNK